MRWNPTTGRLQDQGEFGNGFEVAWDVNAGGMVVGYRQVSAEVTRAVMWQPVTSEVVIDDSSNSCVCSCWGDIVDAEGELPESDPFGGDVGYQVGAVSGPMVSMYGSSAAGGNFGGFFGGTGGGGSYAGVPRGNAGGFGGRWWWWRVSSVRLPAVAVVKRSFPNRRP